MQCGVSVRVDGCRIAAGLQAEPYRLGRLLRRSRILTRVVQADSGSSHQGRRSVLVRQQGIGTALQEEADQVDINPMRGQEQRCRTGNSQEVAAGNGTRYPPRCNTRVDVGAVRQELLDEAETVDAAPWRLEDGG